HAHEQSTAIVIPMVVLACLCFLLGIGAPIAAVILRPAIVEVTGFSSSALMPSILDAVNSMSAIAFGAFLFLAVLVTLAIIRSRLLSQSSRGEAGTWDCGYAQPTARMQYTASSYAQPLVMQFKHFLWTRYSRQTPTGIFPHSAKLSTHT